jgi:hypothetical protein
MSSPKPCKCPCGCPAASWRECPAAHKAGYCKACFGRYLLVVESVADLKKQVEKLEMTS